MAHVNVFIRQRPLTALQQSQVFKTRDSQEGVHVVAQKDGQAEREIVLDGFWDPLMTQDQVFQQVGKPSCERALSGYNATVICFGPTSSGKTYTTFGEPGNNGIVPRIIEYVFQQKQINTQQEFHFYVSFVELYLDQPYDLLCDAPASRPGSAQQRPGSAGVEDQRKTLNLKQAITGQFYAENLTVKQVKTATEMSSLLRLGEQQRATFSTNLNDRSSRSHAIFSIGIISKNRVTGIQTGSLLTCVDLAGSESLKKSGSEGQRLVEAASINKTLLTLGFVVQALAQNSSHIPYRESKLTKLLQEALGGSSYTVMICCLYPLLDNINESMQTLNFANKCRNIITQPKCGVVDLSNVEQENKIKVLVAEVEQLKGTIQSLQSENEKLKQGVWEDNGMQQSLTQTSLQPGGTTTLERQQGRNIPLKANLEINKQQQQQSKSTSQKEQQSDIMKPKTAYDSMSQLRQKLETKTNEYHEMQMQLREKEAQRKSETTTLQNEVLNLKHRIEELETHHDSKIKELVQQHEEKIQKAITAQETITKNQQQILNNVGRKTPDMLSVSMKRVVNEQNIEDIQKQVLQKCDQQKIKELADLKQIHDKNINDLDAKHKVEIANHQLKHQENAKYVQDLHDMVVWFSSEHKNLIELLNDAKSGRLDSYILNEQELMQQYLNYDFSQKKQRHKVKCTVLVDQSREPRVIPQAFNETLDRILTEAQQNSILLSKPPVIGQAKIPDDFYQPRMLRTFANQKPPIVMLDTDIHISPRPKSALGQQPSKTEAVIPKRPQSAMSGKMTSTIGSCGGTASPVNKKYQQWGW